MSTRYLTSELTRRRRRAVRARARSKFRESGVREDADWTEYRGRESYEQQTSEGRGGQSGMFDQRDYPPRTSVPGEQPPEDDGQLVPPEDRLI